MTDKKNLTGGDEPSVRRVKSAEPEVSAPETGEVPTGAPKAKRIQYNTVTPEEVQAKLAAARAKRAAKKASKPPRQMDTLFRGVLASLLGIGIIGTATALGAANAEYSAESATNQGEHETFEGALEELTPEEGVASGQAVVEALAAAQARSAELATAQQGFAAIAYEANAEPDRGDGTPKAAVLKSLEHRKVIVGFFAPTSLLLSEEDAYSFRTNELVDAGQIDPRQPWFTRYETGADGVSQQLAAPESYAWETASVQPSGRPDVVDVVWTNTDVVTGELLSWAEAQYSAETGLFSELEVSMTTQGAAQQLKASTITTESTEGNGA